MHNKDFKLIVKIITLIFIILLLIYFFNSIGIFNFYYHTKFNKIAGKIKYKYIEYINFNKEVIKKISLDEFIRNSIIQYNINNDFSETLKQISIYLNNYDNIVRISLFNYKYKLILTSDITKFSLSKDFENIWFNIASEKGIYISSIYFDPFLKKFLITYIIPVKNIVNEVIGFLLSDCDMSDFLYDINQNYEHISFAVLNNSGKIIYASDNKNNIKEFTKNFLFIKEYKLEDLNSTIIIKAGDNFNRLSNFYIFLLIIFSIILISILIYYGLEYFKKHIELRNKKIKEEVKKILDNTKKIGIETISVIEKEDKEEDKESLEEFLRKREEKLKKEKQKEEEKALKENKDDKKKKVKKEFNDDFIVIE